MALELDSWAVNGAQSSPRIARLQLQSATRGGNGVVDVADLLVQQLAVAGTSVRIASGGAVIKGAEAVFQGSYYAFNVGEVSVPIAATGGSTRSDLVILRVEDPNISGTPWTWDPAVDPIYYFRVISGVSSTTTKVPAGTTGVALARIDIPASTSVITSAMIHDVRVQPDPRGLRVLRVQRGGSQVVAPPAYDEAGNVTADFERWPQHDWSVTIPTWAVQVQIKADWLNVFLKPQAGGTTGGFDARGQLRIALVGTSTLTTASTAYNFNEMSTTNGYRCSAGCADQIDIPASLRGQTVQVQMQVKGDAGQSGRLLADNWANFACDLEFLEVPAPEAAL